MPAALPSALTVNTAAGPDQIALVGPSFWGAVYRSAKRPCFYRLLAGDVGLDQIHQAHSWVHQPQQPGAAKVAEVDHSYDPELSFYFIRYEVPGADMSFSTVLAADDPRRCLACLAKALEALPAWRGGTAQALLAMPADIVFTTAGTAVLLAAPFTETPRATVVFEELSRIRYLSPERVRGIEPASPDGDVAHAVAAILVECLYRTPAGAPEEELLRAAAGVLFAPSRLESRLPAWMQRLGAAREACDEAARLLSPQAHFDPIELATRVRDWSRRMHPVEAIEELRRAGRGQDALDLLRAMIRSPQADPEFREKSYELLIFGGAIASEELGHPFDALEFHEMAIAQKPARPEAYQAQLAIIARLETNAGVGRAAGAGPESLRDLDSILWRDFGFLPAAEQRQHEGTASRYLLNRRRFGEAANFIYPRLFDEAKRHLFWKFELNLDYAEALIGLGSLDDARVHLDSIKRHLRQVDANGSVPKPVIRQHGQRLSLLEILLLRATELRAALQGPIQ
jgi:hypothetical protein